MKTERRRSNRQPPSTRFRGRLSFSGSWEVRRDSRSPVAMPFTRGGYDGMYTSPSGVWVTAMRGASSRARPPSVKSPGPPEFPVCSFPVCSSRMEGCRNTNGKSMVCCCCCCCCCADHFGGVQGQPGLLERRLALVCVCTRDASSDPSYRGPFIISCSHKRRRVLVIMLR